MSENANFTVQLDAYLRERQSTNLHQPKHLPRRDLTSGSTKHHKENKHIWQYHVELINILSILQLFLF